MEAVLSRNSCVSMSKWASGSNASSCLFEQFNIDLLDRHLPIPAKAGLIRWDRTANEAQKEPRFRAVSELLNAITERDPIILGDEQRIT